MRVTNIRNRDVAQLASAPRSGRGGRKFEPSHPDFLKQRKQFVFPAFFISMIDMSLFKWAHPTNIGGDSFVLWKSYTFVV